MKLAHPSLIRCAAVTWLAMGLYLLPLGLYLLKQSLLEPLSSPLIAVLSMPLQRPDYAVIILIALGLLLGYYKGRLILAKAARREVVRIRRLANPASIFRLYSLRFYILVALMMGLGIALRLFGVPSDVRGVVDVAVGAALIHGGIVYLRSSFMVGASAPDL